MFTRKDNEPYPLRVFWEHSEGQFVLVSKHRSGAVAERSFQAGLKRQPKDRSFVMDVAWLLGWGGGYYGRAHGRAQAVRRSRPHYRALLHERRRRLGQDLTGYPRGK